MNQRARWKQKQLSYLDADLDVDRKLSAYHRDEKSPNFAEAYNENLKSHLIEDSHLIHPK